MSTAQPARSLPGSGKLQRLLHPQPGSKRYIDVIFFIVPLPWVLPLVVLGLSEIGIVHLRDTNSFPGEYRYGYGGPDPVDHIPEPLAIIGVFVGITFFLSLAAMFTIALIRITYRIRHRAR